MKLAVSKLVRVSAVVLVVGLGALLVDRPGPARADDPAAAPTTSAAPAASVEPVASSPGTATGSPPAAVDSAKRETGIDAARKYMDAGQQLFSQGRYREAAQEFEAAYDAMPYSAFLYNAAFAAEKAGDRQRAIVQYDKFLASDPASPDAVRIRETIERLKQELSSLPPAAAVDAGVGEGGGGGDAGTDDSGAAAPVPADQASMAEIRSLLLVESDPPGAPLVIYERIVPMAASFDPAGENAGWRPVVHARTPKDLSLRVGHYHVLIEAFQDFKRCQTAVDLSPGHVYTFKANLSQGEFLGFLRVKSNVENAKVFLDDPPPHKTAPWVRTPRGDRLNHGEHDIWVEAPGYQPEHRKVSTPHGQNVEIDVPLERVDYGYLVIDGNAELIQIEVDEQQHPSFQQAAGPTKIKLPAGKHLVALDADGLKTYEVEVEIPKGQELGVHATLNESYPRGKAIALGVIGTLAVGGGVWLHYEAERRGADPVLAADDGTKVFQYGRFGAWGLGAVLVGLSVFYSIYDPYPDSAAKVDKARDFPEDGDATTEPAKDQPKPADEKKSAAFRPFIAPVVAPRAGGLVVGGTF